VNKNVTVPVGGLLMRFASTFPSEGHYSSVVILLQLLRHERSVSQRHLPFDGRLLRPQAPSSKARSSSIATAARRLSFVHRRVSLDSAVDASKCTSM
jgi:hypothetical protein